jgi:hypothetical protein
MEHASRMVFLICTSVQIDGVSGSGSFAVFEFPRAIARCKAENLGSSRKNAKTSASA